MAIRERYGFKTIPKSDKVEGIYRNEKLNVAPATATGSKLNKGRLGVQLKLRDIEAEEGKGHTPIMVQQIARASLYAQTRVTNM